MVQAADEKKNKEGEKTPTGVGGRAQRREQQRVESADDSDQFYSDNEEESRPGAVRVPGINHVPGDVDDDIEASSDRGSNRRSTKL